jgi:quinol monooxygenase YgiN
MIRLNCFIQANPGKADELLAIAKKLVEKSLTDKGCIAYDVFVSGTRPDVLLICETWADNDALTAHSQAPHFTTLVPQMQAIGAFKTERFEF